jgi:cobalamin biosynthesis protein CobD/CbiB
MLKAKFIVGAALCTLLLTSCGYQGQYRYQCQDPVNWETPECKPPVCSVAGTCPVDLVGKDIFEGTTETQTTPEGGTNE